MAASIPTVDLSPFFTPGDEEGREKARDIINEASSKYGFFQIVNHGVPLDLMNRAMALSKTFFEYPEEEKLKVTSGPGAPIPAGYNKIPDHSADDERFSLTYPPEYLLMFPPGSTFNAFPTTPPDFQEVVEELFTYFTKTCQLVEAILTDCLGLPPNFLKEYNDDRSWDLLSCFHYFKATETENTGVSEHEDVNYITLVLQDEVGGLEVLKNGEWLPVIPAKGTIVVNISDVIQVLSNDKFKSATHRVIRSKERSRYSYAYFYNLQGDKWVEPLPEFTKAIGEAPKYRGFEYKEYLALRNGNKTVTKPQDLITITHYSISPN